MTPQGLPRAYEGLPGNPADSTTLRAFWAQYGKARRVWCMDRGVPTEAVLEEMQASNPPVQYLVGTPKGRLTRLERALEAHPPGAATPENHRRTDHREKPRVVQTFAGHPMKNQLLDPLVPRESAKCG